MLTGAGAGAGAGTGVGAGDCEAEWPRVWPDHRFDGKNISFILNRHVCSDV